MRRRSEAGIQELGEFWMAMVEWFFFQLATYMAFGVVICAAAYWRTRDVSVSSLVHLDALTKNTGTSRRIIFCRLPRCRSSLHSRTHEHLGIGRFSSNWLQLWNNSSHPSPYVRRFNAKLRRRLDFQDLLSRTA